MWMGLFGLYSLRNQTVQRNEAIYGPIVGFATIIQKIAPLPLLVFIILSIIKNTYYYPFLYLGIGIMVSVIIGRIFIVLKITSRSNEKSKFGMLLSAIITCIALFLMIFHLY